MQQPSRTFRVFVSSTFSDLKAERNALQEKVFPRLQKLAVANGCRFQAVDLRWGVSEEAALDQRTMKICLNEIDRCQKKSPRPNFIILLGDRYGWQPLPYEIPADEFDQITHLISKEEKILLDTWYFKDINAVPANYILQPRKGKYIEHKAWEQVENKIHSIFHSVINRLNITPESILKYNSSATEQEIVAGALKTQNAKEHVFGYFREIDGIPEDESNKDFLEANKDVQVQLKRLKVRLREVLEDNAHDYKSKWKDNEPSLDHINQFCEDVFADLSSVMKVEIKKLNIVDPLDQDINAHEAFGKDRARILIGRDDMINAISEYIKGNNRNPLVVCGESGCGKSALMAKAIEQCQEEVIYRFIGATPMSSDGRNLLESLCYQISKQYGKEVSDIPSTYNELVFEFAKRLELATPESPLTIFLDALDQLSNNSNARSLSWLPDELPPNVHIIVSTIPDECLQILENRISKKCKIHIQPMSLKEGETILNIWLNETGRALQKKQREEILKNFEKCRLPLYLKLAFEEARHWRSYDGLADGENNKLGLGADIPEILENLFWRLSQEKNHGIVLVSHSLGYLSAAKNGLSEEELIDVLSSDKDVMEDYRRRSPNSPQTKRIPNIVWSRLYADLEPYLTEQASDGSSLLGFYHRQLGKAVENKYLSVEDKRHRIIADYFAKQNLQIEQDKEKTPNLRKLSEQPFQQTHAGLWVELRNTLTDFDFMEAKCEYFSIYDLEKDYETGLELWKGKSEDKMIVSVFEERFRLESHKINKTPNLLFSILYNHLYWLDAEKKGPICSDCIHAAKKRKKWLRSIHNPQLASPTWKLSLGGHTAGIRAVSITPDCQHVISVSMDKAIKVWELSTGKLLRTLEGHNDYVNAISVTPDGKYLISGSGDYFIGSRDCTIKIWELSTGKLLRSLEGHNESINAVIVTPDGNQIISGSYDKTIKVWELSTGKLLRSLDGHTSSVHTVSLTSDGKYIVSGSWDNTIKIWEFSTGRLLHSLDGHIDWVYSVSVSPDGKYIVSGSGDYFGDSRDCTIKIWELSTGRLIRNLEGHTKSVNTVQVTQDGNQIVSGSHDMTIKLWEFSTGKLTSSLEGHTDDINAVSVTPNGKYIVSGSNDKTIKVWDFSTGRLLCSFQGHTEKVNTVKVTPNNKYVISGSGDYYNTESRDCTIKIWELATGKLICSLEGHTSGVSAVCVTFDCKYIISGSYDGTIKVWEFATGKLLRSLCPKWTRESVNSVTITPDGKYIVSGSNNTNSIKVWEFATGKLQSKFCMHILMVNAVSVTPDGKYIISGSQDNTIKICELSTGKLLHSLEGHTDNVNTVSVTPDGKYVVSGSQDKTVKVWEFVTGRLQSTFDGHRTDVKDVSVTPDGKHIVSGAGDNTIKVWELLTVGLQRSLEGHINNYAKTVSVTPDSKHVISGSSDRTIKIWELSTGRLLSTLQSFSNGEVTTVSVTPDGKYIISGSGKAGINGGRVIIWELATGKLLRNLKWDTYGVTAVSVTPDGKYIVSGSSDRTIKVWKLSTGRLLRRLKGHEFDVRVVNVSPDGKHIVSGSWDTTIKVWEIATGRLLRTLEGHTDYVNAVIVMSDGKHVVSGSRDNTIVIWDIQGCNSRTLFWNDCGILSLSISKDGNWIIAGDEKGRVWIFEWMN